MTTQGGFLDKDDLRSISGKARIDAQEAWLKAEGIPHKRQGNRITVCWTHVHAWVEGRPLVSFVEPDFSSLEG